MNSPLQKKRRNAFTLVEILIVIAIIGILVGLTFAIAGPVMVSISKTKAKSQIQKISLALNDFKSRYGEYPMAENGGGDDTWQRLLIDSMRGDKILVRRNGRLSMVSYKEGRTNAEILPFLALGEFTLDEEDDIDTATKILDPWENPYQYRYKTISNGKPDSRWDAPTFLLISAGPDFNDPVETSDYFVGDMETTGLFETDSTSESYYYEDKRSDNLVNLDMSN